MNAQILTLAEQVCDEAGRLGVELALFCEGGRYLPAEVYTHLRRALEALRAGQEAVERARSKDAAELV